MTLLMFVPLVLLLTMALLLGAATGTIAKFKHRNRLLWWIAGMFGYPIAIISVLCFQDLELLSAEQRSRSKLKEKTILTIILFIWVVTVACRIRMALASR